MRGRRAAQLHEDRPDHAGLRRRAGPRRGAGAHRTALRRGHEGRVLRAARDPGAGRGPGGWLGEPCGPDRRGHAALRARARSLRARGGPGGRRRQFHHRLRPGGGEEGHPGGARGGGSAQLRPRHARGDQPRPHGPDLGSALHHRAGRGGQPRARGHRPGPDRLRRQRHDRHPDGQPCSLSGGGGCPGRHPRRGALSGPRGFRGPHPASALERRLTRDPRRPDGDPGAGGRLPAA